MARAYQINSKTIAIFSAFYTVRSTRTIFFSREDLLETFSKDCAKELRRRPDHCFTSRCYFFLVKMSLKRAFLVRRFCQWFGCILSTVRLFLSNEGTAVFENWTAFCL